MMMKMIRLAPVVALALVATLVPSPTAHARAGATSCEHQTLKETYTANYYAVRRLYGKRAPGRNIRKWGLATTRPSRCRDLHRSLTTLRRMREPGDVASHLRTTAPYLPPANTGTVRMRSGGLPDCTWRPESGGDYSAVNPSSGAFGRYQIIPSTWAAHCSDLSRSASGQDQCAARVFEAQGAGAWVNC